MAVPPAEIFLRAVAPDFRGSEIERALHWELGIHDGSGANVSKRAAKFGTFTGVFTPTLLTILGVIMYVRLGWVVGNAGLLGAWLVMTLALGITACTALSLSSIATNTRLGDGGPYALISRSLGLEVGGSIGIPLYLSRPLGVAMYIFGFREGWLWVFPLHDPLLVDLVVFVGLFALAYASADIAFRVQFAIMAVIVVSLAMIFGSPQTLQPDHAIVWTGDYIGFKEQDFSGTSFWVVFAVFFPATTGILAGANMSGELKDSRKSIPRGTIWAVVVSSLIYFALAWWVARVGTPKELATNYTIMIDKSLWAYGVLAGLLGATFSSALASAVGGPRILMAMGQDGLLPRSEWLARTSPRGEPRNAVILTAVLSLAALMVRDLNAIAPLITMFFLITYLMINVVLLLEESLRLISFRPTLRFNIVVPLLGAVGCVFAMFIVNPTFGVVAVLTVIGIYGWIMQRGVKANVGDMRSSVFGAMAEWAAAKFTQLGGDNVRAWKPNLMVPVDDPEEIRGEFEFLVDICQPEGSIKLLGVAHRRGAEELRGVVQQLDGAFQRRKLFSTWSILECEKLTYGVMISLQALQSAFFRPNILFMTLPDEEARYEEFGRIIVQARETGVGILFLGQHRKVGFGQRQVINAYVRPDISGWELEAAFAHNNLDLTLLVGLRLARRWGAQLNLITVVSSEGERLVAEQFLAQVVEGARFPATTGRLAMVGAFSDCVTRAPQSDLDLMGLQPNPNFAFMNEMIAITRSACLFVADSGRESIRA